MEKYWRSIDEIETGPVEDKSEKSEIAHKHEVTSFLEDLPLKASTNRRDFLKFMGFSIGTAVLVSACEKPVQKAIPFLNQPFDLVPGKASYYASTFFDGSEYCPILVKVRDGRPIKIEGNDLYTYTLGGTLARVQASVLSLYDNARIKSPLKNNNQITWINADKEIAGSLKRINKNGKEIVLLTSTIFSPSTLKAIEEFKAKYPTTKVLNYDVVSYSGIVDAYKETTGKSAIPYPLFDNADIIVNFGADFLGTWLLPTEFTLAYVSKRKLEKGNKKMSRHIQYEANLSLTGSNADERFQIKPSEEINILANLYNLLAERQGRELIEIEPAGKELKLENIATDLLEKKGKSIILSGSNDVSVQKIVIAINQLLENYGKTFDIEKPILLKQGSDSEMFELVENMKAGKVGAIFFNNANPGYDYYESTEFKYALEKVDLKVSFSGFPNETLQYCDYVCPDHHYLESWCDYEPRLGIYSIAQPCIHNIFDTRQMQESILIWSGNDTKFDDYIRKNLENGIFKKQNTTIDSGQFWITTLRNGFVEINENEKLSLKNISGLKDIAKNSKTNESFELQLVVPIGIASGYHSNNPWLQELPDPISRVTWGNYASVSPKLAKEMSLKTGDVIKVSNKFEIPVVVQPGQAYRVITVALNYGRTAAGKVAEEVGVDMYPLIIKENKNLQFFQTGINIIKTGKSVTLAQTQTHHTMEGREIVRETTLAEYEVKPNAGNEFHEEFETTHQTLYPEIKYDNFHWGLGIDLNSCTGCGACVVACQAENNVAVVGKEQVTKRRIMHWLRVDRYYTGLQKHLQFCINL